MNINVVVEIPKGSRNKYEMDHETGLIRLDRMLFTSTRYPLDYGFIPGTLAEDGDLLDVLIMLDEPTFPAHDPRAAAVMDLNDIPTYLTAEIGHFFDIYKEIEPGKATDVRGWQDRAAAEQVITEAFDRVGTPAEQR